LDAPFFSEYEDFLIRLHILKFICKKLTYFFHAGNSYYIGFFKNRDGGSISLYLSNTGSLDLSYAIEAPGIGYFTTDTISVKQSAHVLLPSNLIAGSYYDSNMGIYLQTNSTNLTVIGQNLYSIYTGGDTFLSLPTVKKACCSVYVYYGISVFYFSLNYGITQSVVLIVGTEDDTIIKLTARQFVRIKIDDTVISLQHGIEYSLLINRLQSVYIGSSRDLTGTRIITNKPVSVFSGHECGYVPSSSYGNCEYLVEQIPPTTYWGKTYYIAPLQGRTGYTIRVLAAYDSTEVVTDCSSVKNLYTINAGDSFTATYYVYCAIHSNKEILVAQYSHGSTYDSRYPAGPMMMLVPPAAHYSNEISLSTASSGFSNYINIIVLKEYYQPSMMYWITGGVKRSLQSQRWTTIIFNHVTMAYYSQLFVSNGTVKIVHRSKEALISAVVHGYRSLSGYGHSGGLSSQKHFEG